VDSPWHIQMFGRLSARRGTETIERFATSRAAALLARLALYPQRTHPREELADLLWPDADLEAGRLSLRVALASLRRQMEPPDVAAGSILIADRSAVRLNPLACRTDVADFEAALLEAARAQTLEKKREALDHALGLYGGELLPGFYDEWILDERERLTAVQEEAKAQRDALPAPKLPLTALDPEAVPAAPLAHPKPLPSGFPLQFTRFFGREAERAALAELLCDPDVSLVTLIGPGGAGKTRLALETVRQVAESFSGPVCFAGLADLSDSALIPVSIAAALRLPLASDCTPLAQVTAHLAGEALLVLDNLEHLGEEGASQVRTLREHTLGLTCLVTSRRCLEMEGERELFLRPLPVPDSRADDSETPAALALSSLALLPSVQLFVDRAQAVRPDFQITAHNAEAVAAICRSLEGMPLALELAAARIQTLTPAQMQAQLAARLDFLISRRRDLPPRHRSLRAALEWSTLLLTAEQTRFFVRLSVFRGGCTLESAAAVCETDRALSLLEQLRERSLLVAEDPEEPGLSMRFRMLESLREFGAEQLSEDECRALNRRHAEYFQALAGRMDAQWDGPEQEHARRTLEAEYDNLRAALTFCRTGDEEENAETGQRLAASLGSYWTLRGLLCEGVDWLTGALSRGGPNDARAGALAASGILHAGLGDYAPAMALLTEAVALCREGGSRRLLAKVLQQRGTAGVWNYEPELAVADFQEAVHLSRETSQTVNEAMALNGLGVLAGREPGGMAEARTLYEQALALFQACGSQQRASYCLHNLGNNANHRGEYDQAVQMLTESLMLADSLGDRWLRAFCLRNLGVAQSNRGEFAEAARLSEEGIAACRTLGDRQSEAGTLLVLAAARRDQRRWAEAEASACAALRLYQDLICALGRAEAWLDLAETAVRQEHWERAASFLSAAGLGEDSALEGEDREAAAALAETTRTALGPAAFEIACGKGQTITCDAYGIRTV